MIPESDIINVIESIIDDEVYVINSKSYTPQLINYFIGRVNYLTHGEADPDLVLKLIKKIIIRGSEKVNKNLKCPECEADNSFRVNAEDLIPCIICLHCGTMFRQVDYKTNNKHKNNECEIY